jgi:AraC family transcriptional regulator, transcriptional activator of the genes for pyochelin and ferripyochelin receptors
MSVQLAEKNAHGLRLTHATAHYAESALRRGASNENVVRLHFGLRGESRVRYPNLERSYARLGAHFSVFYASPFELEFVNETPLLETFGIKLPVSQFVAYVDGTNLRVSRFCERIAGGQAGFLFEPSMPLLPPLEHTIRRMLECRYAGALEELYLLSGSIELLVRTLEIGTRDPAAQEHAPITRSDRDRLFAARDLVDSRLTDPPALAEVAKRVGLNEYKLKRGFKQLFGSSVFAYLSAQRLELARRMLLETDKTAAEVAFALGYATPQHFNHAFKRQFGVTPKSMTKTS